MIFTDKRFKPYLISIALILINLVVFIFCQFDSDYSLFGTNLDSGLISKLAFNTSEPVRLYGLNLLTSIFTHQNLSHFLLNILFFSLISFATEKYLVKLEFIFFIVITQSIPLMLTSLFISGDHLFLGVSLVCYGLFSLYSMITKKYYFFAIALTIISINLIIGPTDWFSLSMHLLGLMMGVSYFLLNTKLLGRRYKTY
jgi:membrane associated rhomboid family serine protease